MAEHDERAREMEREAYDMEQRSEHVEDEIDEARNDWARKKRDPGVPGAAGDPETAEEGQQPETSYPSKGDEE